MEATQNDHHVADGLVFQPQEIDYHAAGDQHPEDGQEFALR